MSLLWPHKVRVAVPESGTTGAFNDQDVWVPVEGPERVLYDGAANVNDAGRVTLGRTMFHTAEGTAVQRSDAVCYLKKKRAAALVPLNATVRIEWRDGTFGDAVVVGVRRGDNSLDLRRV